MTAPLALLKYHLVSNLGNEYIKLPPQCTVMSHRLVEGLGFNPKLALHDHVKQTRRTAEDTASRSATNVVLDRV